MFNLSLFLFAVSVSVTDHSLSVWFNFCLSRCFSHFRYPWLYFFVYQFVLQIFLCQFLISVYIYCSFATIHGLSLQIRCHVNWVVIDSLTVKITSFFVITLVFHSLFLFSYYLWSLAKELGFSEIDTSIKLIIVLMRIITTKTALLEA